MDIVPKAPKLEKEPLEAPVRLDGQATTQAPPPPPEPVNEEAASNVVETMDTMEPVEPVETRNLFENISLDMVGGITPGIQEQLEENGIVTIEQLLALDQEDLKTYNGVGEVRAEMILNSARSFQPKVVTPSTDN